MLTKARPLALRDTRPEEITYDYSGAIVPDDVQAQKFGINPFGQPGVENCNNMIRILGLK